jgi:hypothetical protein
LCCVMLSLAIEAEGGRQSPDASSPSSPQLESIDAQIRGAAAELLDGVEARLRGCTNYRDVLRITLRVDGTDDARRMIDRHAPRRCALFVADGSGSVGGPRRVAKYFPAAAMIYDGATLTLVDRSRSRENPAGRYQVLATDGDLILTKAYAALPPGNEGLEHPLLGTLLRRSGDGDRGTRWLFAPFGRVDAITRREANGRAIITLAGTTGPDAIQGGGGVPPSALELDVDETTGLPTELRVDATAQVRTMLLAMKPVNESPRSAIEITRAWQVFSFEDQSINEPDSPALAERFSFRPVPGMKRVESFRDQPAPAPATK